MMWIRRRRPTKPARVGSTVTPPRGSLVIRSAESTRMTGLRSIPTERRQAAVDAFLATIK